mgnify:CR=1 FL=1
MSLRKFCYFDNRKKKAKECSNSGEKLIVLKPLCNQAKNFSSLTEVCYVARPPHKTCFYELLPK